MNDVLTRFTPGVLACGLDVGPEKYDGIPTG
jgi:hypothetical protein